MREAVTLSTSRPGDQEKVRTLLLDNSNPKTLILRHMLKRGVRKAKGIGSMFSQWWHRAFHFHTDTDHTDCCISGIETQIVMSSVSSDVRRWRHNDTGKVKCHPAPAYQ